MLITTSTKISASEMNTILNDKASLAALQEVLSIANNAYALANSKVTIAEVNEAISVALSNIAMAEEVSF